MNWLSKALGIKGKDDRGDTEINDLSRGTKCWRWQNEKNGAPKNGKKTTVATA